MPDLLRALLVYAATIGALVLGISLCIAVLGIVFWWDVFTDASFGR